MKILWLSHLIPYPPKGGVLQRSYNLVRELARYHEVDVLAFNQCDLMAPLFSSVEEGVNEAYQVMGEYCRYVKFFNLPSDAHQFGRHLLAMRSLIGDSYNVNWLKSTEYAAAVKARIIANDYDVVHFDTISLAPFFDLVPDDVFTVLDHHNIESHMLFRRARKERNLLKKFYFWQEAVRLERYEKKCCPQFSLNITCSGIDKERLIQLVPNAKVGVVPNGVDLDYFQPKGLEPRPESLIFVGTLNWYPNIEAVLYIANELWPKLKHRYPNLEFNIIGANPPKEIQALSARDDGFKVHGFVDDVRPFIEEASVYICPIKDGGGTKLKILDAMAMKKPVVADPIACEGILVTENENILFACTDDDYIDQIVRLLADRSFALALGERARQLMKDEYSYRNIGRQFSSLLEIE